MICILLLNPGWHQILTFDMDLEQSVELF